MTRGNAPCRTKWFLHQTHVIKIRSEEGGQKDWEIPESFALTVADDLENQMPEIGSECWIAIRIWLIIFTMGRRLNKRWQPSWVQGSVMREKIISSRLMMKMSKKKQTIIINDCLIEFNLCFIKSRMNWCLVDKKGSWSDSITLLDRVAINNIH